jgi:hypothetical protein
MLKRGQTARPAIIMVGISVLAFALFLFLGFRASEGVTRNAQELQRQLFVTELMSDMEVISAKYGSVTREDYAIPRSIQKVCFVDTENVATDSPTLSHYPMIRNSLESGLPDNVFVYGKELLYSIDIGPLKLSAYPYIRCIGVNGRLNLLLEGAGKGTELVTDFTVSKQITQKLRNEIILRSINDFAELRLAGDTDVSGTATKVSLTPTPPDDAYPPDQVEIVSETYLFEPEDASFDPPAEITIRYAPGLLPAGTAEEDLLIWHFNDGVWTPLETEVDTEENTATAKVTHFCHAGVGTRKSDVERDIPVKEVEPGDYVTIKLKVDINNRESLFAVEERPPSGWEIVDKGGGTLADSTLRWAGFDSGGLRDATLTYKVMAPDQPGTHKFKGQFLIGDQDITTIAGDNTVSVKASTPQPSCDDGIQNQGEEGIDCGGPCPPCQCYDSGWVVLHDWVVDGSGCQQNAEFPGGWDCYTYDKKWHKLRVNVPSSGPYEISFEGHFTGPSQKQEDLRVELNGQTIDWHESNNWDKGWHEFTMPEPLQFELGSNEMVIKSPCFDQCHKGGSIHFGKVRVTNCQPGTCDDGIQNQGEEGIDCGGPCPPCASQANLRIVPDDPTPEVGQEVVLEITVDNVEDLMGVQFNVIYDPAKMEYIGKENGDFLNFCTDGEPGDGQVKNLACTSTAGPKSGSGNIMKLTFVTIAPGDAEIGFDNVLLVDSQNELLSVKAHGTVLHINSQGGPMLVVEPRTDLVSVGEKVMVDIYAKDLTDVMGVQFDIEFDSTRLSSEGTDYGDFLDSCPVEPELDGAVIRNFACVALGGPKSGTGVLATLEFTAISPGSAVISIEDPTKAQVTSAPMVCATITRME